MITRNHIRNTWGYIKRDYNSWPFRFYVEAMAWTISISNSLIMAFTVPNPPLIWIYPVWIMGCSMCAWAAYTRQSAGMLMNYALLCIIDLVGFSRMLAKLW